MAQKTTKTSDKTTVRRIKATDDVKPVKKTQKAKEPKSKITKIVQKPTKKTLKPKKSIESKMDQSTKNPFVALGRYFKGAWYELKQVRWPSRSATWSMTLAVILFTLFFVALVLLLDAGFKWIFEQLLR